MNSRGHQPTVNQGKTFDPAGVAHLVADGPWVAPTAIHVRPLRGPATGARLLLCALAFLPIGLCAATNDLSTALQTGLFEEEANRNLPAAIESYEKVAKQFDQNRALAATAIFRLGEVNRKLGKTNEAAAFYQRILREFGDQDTLTKLSQQNLAGMGVLPRTAAAVTETSTVSLNVLSTAEAEAATLVNQVRQLETAKKGVELLQIVQQNYSNPVLTKLFQDLATAEQQLVVVSRDFGPQNGNYINAQSLINKIKSQINEATEGVLIGLRAKRDAAVATAKALREQTGQSATTQSPKSGDSAPITAVLDEEETEIRRIQAMIQNSPDLINAPAGEDGTPLYRAASRGQLRVAAFLLDHGADVNTRAGAPSKTYSDWTPLFAAASRGHKAMVELLASRGANVDATVQLMVGKEGGNLSGGTALHQAVAKGFQAVAESLLAKKADINARSRDGWTPLHHSTYAGHVALTAFLLSKGADVNASDSQGGTALMYAARDGHLETLQKLIAAKAGINAELTSGQTALSLAAGNGHQECVNALLAAKADPNAGKANLPLHCAIKAKSAGIVEALLKAGADANRVGKVTWAVAGESPGAVIWTPLAMAVRGGQTEIVKQLLAHKADPNNKDCGYLIFFALTNADLMKALLDAGAKPNVEDGSNNRRTPLSSANDPEVIGLLLAAGADPEVNLPLINAVNGGRLPVAEALLKGGANVNAVISWSGKTALHCATENKNAEMVALLLAHKADVNARDNQGLTPLDYAQAKNQGAGAMASGSLVSFSSTPPPPPPPLSYQWSTESGRAETKPLNAADLLRQHGGLADLPKLDRIEVTRPDTGYRATAFLGGTNGWNQFTLAEVLAQQWGLLATRRSGPWEKQRSGARLNVWQGNALRFPDLSRIKIHSPTKGVGTRTTLNADLTIRDEKTGTFRNVVLQMGDVVEVPEADRPVNDFWLGPVPADFQALSNAIVRTVGITVSGKSTNLTLVPVLLQLSAGSSWIDLVTPSFMLRSVLDESKLIRSSSDLTRVKVTRRESTNAKPRVWIVDCSIPDKAPDLWLRDGDVIEVPEK